jgi:hypothetical protein
MYALQQRYGLPPRKTAGVALGAGFLALVSLALFVAALRTMRERASVRASLAGEPPVDGRRTAFVGTIDAAGESLRSPLSGKECLAWKYQISRFTGTSRRRVQSVYYEGIALVPSILSTRSGRFRLLAVPEFEFAPEHLDAGRAAHNAAEHVRTAVFEEARRTLEKQWTDDDGAYRSETRNFPAEATPPPLEECQFREDLIPRRENVYVFGLYSEARGGIVPHKNWAKTTRIMRGDGDSILRQLGRRVRGYVIGAVLAAGAAVAVVGMFASGLAH